MAGLLSLIGQAVGIQPDYEKEGISVDGVRSSRQTPPIETDAGPMPLSNRSFIEEASDAASKYPERKGRLFGTKGTLRDVLGTLGDAFLVQSGNKAVYGPRRDQERASDAMAGFTQNPLAAIERLAYENPDLAKEVYNDYMTNQAKQAQTEATSEYRNSLIQDRTDKRAVDFTNWAARTLANADTPERLQAAINTIKRRAPKGIDVNRALGVENIDALTPDEQYVLGRGDMTVNQQEQLPIRKYQAETSRISATKPPAPRQPRSQTELEYYKELSDIPAAKRTPEQRAFIDKYTRSGKGSKKVDINSLPLPAGFDKSKIKKVN